MSVRSLALACCFALIAGAAVAAPRSIADCEAIQASLAYNACLASFGPTRANHGGGRAYAPARGAEGGAPARRRQAGPPGARVESGRGGRVRMEFTPAAGR